MIIFLTFSNAILDFDIANIWNYNFCNVEKKKMKTGPKLIIIGIILFSYWTITTYVRIITIETLILEQHSEDAPIMQPLVYPWWWFVILIRDYAGMASFILIVVGIVKSYLVWRFGK